MEYTRLGRSEIIVSRLALGCWQASPDWQSFDAQRFTQTVYAALSNGITLFDTAPVYGAGSSEELLSKALDSERTRVVIATKFTHRDSAPHKLRLAVEESLRRLRTDYIDLYQQHWPSPNIPFAETQEELLRLQHEGKIRAIGVSNWMEPEFAAHSDLSHIQTLQPSYSLLWRSIEKNVFCLLYTSPSPRDLAVSRMPSSA